MQGDSFADPRKRSTRGSRGRGGGRGRGRQPRRGSKNVGQTRRSRAPPDLGSNEYRFHERDTEQGGEYDALVDFSRAAADPTFDSVEAHGDKTSVSDVFSALSVDFRNLDKVLESIPLWVRLGSHTKYALDVPDEETEEKYIASLLQCAQPDAASPTKNDDGSMGQLLSEVENISLKDDENCTNDDKVASTEASSVSNVSYNPKEIQHVTNIKTSQGSAGSDDFDKWLDQA